MMGARVVQESLFYRLRLETMFRRIICSAPRWREQAGNSP
jgi:hypothetical protein